MNQPDCAFPECMSEQRTPPAVNDEAPGASGADSGQGACTQRYRLHMSWPAYEVDAREVDPPETLDASSPRECADWLQMLLDRGALTVTVELL